MKSLHGFTVYYSGGICNPIIFSQLLILAGRICLYVIDFFIRWNELMDDFPIYCNFVLG